MNDNWAEKLVDAHLEVPNTVEPSLGFESRLLGRLAERKVARRPVFWMFWASAALATTIIAIVFFTRPLSQKPAHVDTAKAVTPAQPAPAVALPKVGPAPAIATQRIAPKQRHRDAVATVAADYRQEVFPAPSPLSEQERLAFAYLRGTPRAEVIAMSRPEPELPQEINQVVPGPELNRTLPSSTR